MTETSQAPQQGIAEALHDLSDHTAALARREARAALRETWQKARQAGPAGALLAAAAIMALFATASAYRLSLRLLEKRLSPAAAALAAAGGLRDRGGRGWRTRVREAAEGLAAAAARDARETPARWPKQTAGHNGSSHEPASVRATATIRLVEWRPV